MKLMTAKQFECCLTNRSGAASQGAKLVLVEGLSVEEAAVRVNLKKRTIYNATSRLRARFDAICSAGPWPAPKADAATPAEDVNGEQSVDALYSQLTPAQIAFVSGLPKTFREQTAKYLEQRVPVVVFKQNEVTNVPPYAIAVKTDGSDDWWLECYETEAEALLMVEVLELPLEKS